MLFSLDGKTKISGAERSKGEKKCMILIVIWGEGSFSYLHIRVERLARFSTNRIRIGVSVVNSKVILCSSQKDHDQKVCP